MKKLISVALMLGLLAGAMVMPAEAAKKKKKKRAKEPVKVERQVTATYAAPATVVGLCGTEDAIGCIPVPTGPEEIYLTGKVTDQHGQPVIISVQADLDGDQVSDTVYGAFCGETTEPIQVDPGVELIVWVGSARHAAPEACVPGVGTQGTVELTLSNML